MIALAKRMPALQGLGLFAQDEPFLAVIPYLGALSELKVQYLRFEGPHEEDTLWMDTLRGCFDTIPTLQWVELWSPESGAWDRWTYNAKEPATMPSHSSSYSDWLSEWEDIIPFH
ncbi:hypothetical protein ONZ45_g11391 [Pleurotus djamor]|nr:hypothetical protein ONZ45_g11391 [Pleurotus djamor]